MSEITLISNPLKCLNFLNHGRIIVSNIVQADSSKLPPFMPDLRVEGKPEMIVVEVGWPIAFHLFGFIRAALCQGQRKKTYQDNEHERDIPLDLPRLALRKTCRYARVRSALIRSGPHLRWACPIEKALIRSLPPSSLPSSPASSLPPRERCAPRPHAPAAPSSPPRPASRPAAPRLRPPHPPPAHRPRRVPRLPGPPPGRPPRTQTPLPARRRRRRRRRRTTRQGRQGGPQGQGAAGQEGRAAAQEEVRRAGPARPAWARQA